MKTPALDEIIETNRYAYDTGHKKNARGGWRSSMKLKRPNKPEVPKWKRSLSAVKAYQNRRK